MPEIQRTKTESWNRRSMRRVVSYTGVCSGVKGKLNWDKSYISEKDSVFPAQNQLNWCKKEGIPAVSLPGGHYPFYRFRSWREILEK